MSDLIKRLQSVPTSVYEQVGNDLTSHDHLCADTAIEAADRIESLEAKLSEARKLLDEWRKGDAVFMPGQDPTEPTRFVYGGDRFLDKHEYADQLEEILK